MVQEFKENTLNAGYTEKVARELRDAYYKGQEKTPSYAEEEERWFKVAEYAIARLQPVAVDAELPNDAMQGSGKKPASEAVHEERVKRYMKMLVIQRSMGRIRK